MSRKAEGGSGVVYRRDIDGMRALAVLLVVFSHLRIYFTGGYIGVDVFLVISGYLISSAIVSEMRLDSFSIVSFYERRIRRIFPALIGVLFGSTLLAVRYSVPSELRAYGTSMLAALYSVSNILFWRQAGYFDTPSLEKPLLHTWSLGVEEQFYIFFPLFVILVFKYFHKALALSVWLIIALSLIASSIWVHHDASSAFFMAPLRAWELLIGTVLSQHYIPSVRSTAARNLCSAAGLLCILIPAVRYTDTTVFPGLSALLPCLGAALIIYAGETGPSLVGWLLGLRPVVFIGLISYSLYLWHWPILVFQKENSFLWRPYGNRPTVLLASLIAAAISWRFIETPFRKGAFRPSRKRLFWIVGTGALAITAAGIAFIVSGGLPARFPPDALVAARYIDFDPAPSYRQNVCFLIDPQGMDSFRPSTCLAEDSRPRYLLLGDSHAADLYTGLQRENPEINLSQATYAGCRSLLHEPSEAVNGCKAMSRFIYGDYLPTHKPKAVLLSGLWSPQEMPELGVTIKHIQQLGIPVIVFGPGIQYDSSMPRIVAISLRDRKPSEVEDHLVSQARDFDRTMSRYAKDDWHVTYISAYDDLCIPKCPTYGESNVPLLFDNQHYTPEGASLLAKVMRQKGQFP